MGCDIHLQFEIRRNGVWTWPLYGLPRYLNPEDFLPRPLAALTERNYGTFRLLAGMRDHGLGILPIALPRGLPPDLSPELTEAANVRLGDDGDGELWWYSGDHSHSWLLMSEVLDYGTLWLKHERKARGPSKQEAAEEIARHTASVLNGRTNAALESVLSAAALELLRDGIRGVCGRYEYGSVSPADARLVFGFDS